MLIEFRVQNFKSINTEQTLNLVCSSSTRENFNQQNLISVDKFGIDSVLKSAAIFGPNGAGKTNFSSALSSMCTNVLSSLRHIDREYVLSTLPFVLKEDMYDIPTEQEVTFIKDGVLYRYGMAISDRIISEEWLYQTTSTRETLLFHRQGQALEYNNRSFSEAKNLVRKEGDGYVVLQTKPHIPFLSVVAQFDGDKSTSVVDWFRNLNIITGVNDDGVKEYSIDLYDSDSEFKSWALKVLSAMQIDDIEVVEREADFPLKSPDAIPELVEVTEKLQTFLRKNPVKQKALAISKDIGEQNFLLPIDIESDGTKRVIYFLGALYDTIKNNKILFVDEFDSKLHSLLSKFLINLYHAHSLGSSQLIVACHDTNLLSKDIFRRDQIWFVDKNLRHESELYSLLEYKEYYSRKDSSYNKDYLAGKYGAIPLFESSFEMDEVCRG
ncbi:ATP-binding protein [Pseudomonas sp. PGPPP4]|uniref:AAA family ATPase n=1 Tax=Pseudomonas sp. PGPPP4 TaxID=2015556 RepID=UPI0025804F12|nr:ATP-binding protein [Pseudomonas sp. PGPPP4]